MKEGWEAEKLVDICKIQYGYPFDSKQFCDDSKYPQLIRIRDVSRGYSETYYSGEIPEGYYIDKGDYLIGMDGEFNIAAWNSERALLNQRVCKITASEETFDRFLFYNLRIILKQIEDETPFVTVKHLSAKRLNAITINLPPLSEQQHIVEELDLLSSIIEKKKAQLNELDNLAQSLFYEMFGDPITNEKSWEVKKLKEACTCITDGDHMPPPKVDKGIPFITISNIDKQNREIDFRDTFFVPQSYYDSIKKERKAQIDDVLYTVTGSYGIPIIVKEDRNFCFQRHIALLRPNKHLVSPCYLCYWALCKSIKYLADDVATGIAQKTVGLSSLREFPIIIPPLSLQQQFASKIEAIEHQKELIKKSIKEVETLFNSRMDYYFN